jgi:hypothetical protein
MKKTFVLLAIGLFSSVSLLFGAELEGFLDLPWGAGPDEARKQISGRTHARFERQKSDDTHLRFDDGKFAGFKAEHLELNFAGAHFFRAEVRLAPVSKEHEKEFAALKKLLTEKYGAPGRDEADRHECTWYFPVTGKPANLINLSADPKGSGLLIFYLSESSKAAAANAGAQAATAKPAKTSANAKDDL